VLCANAGEWIETPLSPAPRCTIRMVDPSANVRPAGLGAYGSGPSLYRLARMLSAIRPALKCARARPFGRSAASIAYALVRSAARRPARGPSHATRRESTGGVPTGRAMVSAWFPRVATSPARRWDACRAHRCGTACRGGHASARERLDPRVCAQAQERRASAGAGDERQHATPRRGVPERR